MDFETERMKRVTEARVFAIKKETDSIEARFSRIESGLLSSSSELDASTTYFEKEIKRIKEDINLINSKLESVISLLKESASDIDVKQLNKKLENFNPELWLTHDQIRNEIKDFLER